MSLIKSAHRVLGYPVIYLWLQGALGADRLRRLTIERFAKLMPGERVLDLGCGPGHIRELMPEIDYVGFDTEQRYIDYARKKYAGKGEFHCEIFTRKHVELLAPFDAILLLGVLHHLDDVSALDLLGLLSECIKPGGRVVTVDPCFTPDQPLFARLVAKSDRGRYVRTAEGYNSLVRPHFASLSAEVFQNVCRIPSTERIMKLREPIVKQSTLAH